MYIVVRNNCSPILNNFFNKTILAELNNNITHEIRIDENIRKDMDENPDIKRVKVYLWYDLNAYFDTLENIGKNKNCFETIYIKN